MRDKAFVQTFVELERIDQRAELVGRPVRQQPAGQLERVEHFRAVPVAQLALQDTDINVGVVGHQGVGIQRLEYFGGDVVEGRRVGDRFVGQAVDAASIRDRLLPLLAASRTVTS